MEKAEINSYVKAGEIAREVKEFVRGLIKPGMKLIIVTYCQSPREQAEAYESVYEICGQAKPA